MFQKGKRAIAFFLACFLCVQMSGCGGTPASSGDAANSSTVSGSTESADSAQSDSSSAASDPHGDASETSGSSTVSKGSATASKASSANPTLPGGTGNGKIDMKGRVIRLHIGQVEASSTSEVGVKFAQKVKEINKRYHCDIQYYVSYDFDAINASIASGKPAVDIRWFNGYEQFLNGYVAGFIQPLEPLGNIDFKDRTRFAEITDICEIDGKHYGVSPMYYCYGEMRIWFSYLMLYNKDMLKKAGITEDLYEVQKSGKWTLAKFEEYAKKLKNAGMTPLVDADGHFYKTMLYAHNTDWILNQGNSAKFNGDSAAAKQVMTDYTRLTSNKLIEVPQLKPEGPWANDSFGFKDYYIKGKSAFAAINGPWLLKWITTGWDKTTKENTGILMIPKKDEASPYYTRASADYAFWGIPYGVKNPAEVALVINALNEPLFKESENLRMLTTNMTPLVNDQGSLDTLKAIYKLGEPVLSYDYLAIGPKVYEGPNGWMMHMQKIANGQESQDAVLKSVVGSYNNLLKDVYKKR